MKATFLVSTVAILSTCAVAARFDPEQCGPKGGYQVCKNNQCCSQYGWCGTTNAYCQAKRGCNPAFGRCTGTTVSSAVRSSSASQTSSTVRSSSTVQTSPTVRPSSAVQSFSATRPSPSPAPIKNKNERCGPNFGGKSCAGSIYGKCCSEYGWCGTTKDHCKTGCQSAFGTCSGIVASLSVKSSAQLATSSRSSAVSSGIGASTASSASVALSSSSAASTIASSIIIPSSGSSVIPSSSSIAATSSNANPSVSAISSVASSSGPSTPTLHSVVSSSSGILTASSVDSTTSASLIESTLSVSPESTTSESSLAPETTSSSPIGSTASASQEDSAASASSIVLSSADSSTPTLGATTSSIASAEPSASATTYIWIPAQNPNLDHTSLDRLVPKNKLDLYYVEQTPGTSSKTDTATLTDGQKGVVLDDIAAIDAVSCSDSTFSIAFAEGAADAIAYARTWPVGTLLFTSAAGCSTKNERGIYSVQDTNASQGGDAPAGRFRRRQIDFANLERIFRLLVTRMPELADVLLALTTIIQKMEPAVTSSSRAVVITPTPWNPSSGNTTSGIAHLTGSGVITTPLPTVAFSSALELASSTVSTPASNLPSSTVPTSLLNTNSSVVPTSLTNSPSSIASTSTSDPVSSSPQSSTIVSRPIPTASVSSPPDFCLKVLTPSSPYSGWFVKNTFGGNGNFRIDPATGGSLGNENIAHFIIADDRKLMVITPGLDQTKVTGHSHGTSGSWRFNNYFDSFLVTTCVIYTDVEGFYGQNVIRCIGGFTTSPFRNFTGFRSYFNKPAGDTMQLWGIEDADTTTDRVELGVFTGADCGTTEPVSSSSASETPSPTDITPSSVPTDDIFTTGTASTGEASTTGATVIPESSVDPPVESDLPQSEPTLPIFSPSAASSTMTEPPQPESTVPMFSPSAAPSTPTDVPQSTFSNAGPSSEAITSTSVTPSEPSVTVSSNFCLRVVTQGLPSSNWVVKQSDASSDSGAFLLDPVEGGAWSDIATFFIDAQTNVMHVSTPGSPSETITRYSRGTGGMFRYAAPYAPLPPNTCAVKTDVAGFPGQQVLKCSGTQVSGGKETYTGFADVDIGSGNHNLSGVVLNADGTAKFGESLLELGLFTGGACPV